MFFKNFNPMTTETVTAKATASPKAGTGLTPSETLKNKQFKMKFTGEHAPQQLDYAFGSDFTLTVHENGTTHKDVPYNALNVRENVVLFTHLIPGTSRGWHCVVDLNTSLITAFETWFGITVPVGGDLMGTREPTHNRDIPREVQRQYHFGYIDNGSGEPAKLHTTTNRLEGYGLYWEYVCGGKMLTFFPSVTCSTNVLLDEPQDTITFTYPSDYLKLSDELFIYAKWGIEFGGEMWLYVIDLFDLKAAGMKLGFDQNDKFNYHMHSAKLTITGQAAHLEKITVIGDKEPPMPALAGGGKGARYAYRPKDIDIPMTRAEVDEAVKASTRIFDTSGPNIMASGYTLDKKYLAGKQFALSYDQVRTPYAWSAKNTPEKLIKEYEYDFTGNEMLKWCELGGQWHEEKYVCFEPAKDIFLYSHMLTGDPDYASVTHAVDFSTGLSTCIYGRIGSWTSEWEVGATVLFGTASGEGIAPAPFSRRHDFSNDLVGYSYAWAYSDVMSSIHTYSSPVSYSWTIFQDDNSGGPTWSSPGFYIKLRPDAYILQWTEENCNGMQGVICFNPRIMHDGGFFYGVGHNGLSLNVTGAYARKMGYFDIMKYFDPKENL
ncbi:MAG: hypothetical protein FWC90_00150 [Oscillospiraceae bacterium]|nr:hypothetical protein [Oscillospiraceae bacterium]